MKGTFRRNHLEYLYICHTGRGVFQYSFHRKLPPACEIGRFIRSLEDLRGYGKAFLCHVFSSRKNYIHSAPCDQILLIKIEKEATGLKQARRCH